MFEAFIRDVEMGEGFVVGAHPGAGVGAAEPLDDKHRRHVLRMNASPTPGVPRCEKIIAPRWARVSGTRSAIKRMSRTGILMVYGVRNTRIFWQADAEKGRRGEKTNPCVAESPIPVSGSQRLFGK